MRIVFKEGKLFMRFLLKIRKRKISIFFLLLFNQFLYSSYAVNLKNTEVMNASLYVDINSLEEKLKEILD